MIAIFIFSIANVCASDVNEAEIAGDGTNPIEVVQSDDISVTDYNQAIESNDGGILSREMQELFLNCR